MPVSDIRPVLKNKRAYFNYEILETLETGIVLKGTEVKSIRERNVSINESYARFHNSELFIYNMDISPYKCGNILNHEPKRPRKLLLKKSEIKRLIGKTSEKGLTLIPLSLYFKNGFAKLEIGLARGKKLYDKREAIKKRMSHQEIQRVMRRR
jgi:SsrA-binding protein